MSAIFGIIGIHLSRFDDGDSMPYQRCFSYG
ncbi:hypothetical protein swp_5073 [Shewanella piezotolerans WP3]|uniref:Uncharacterized protein n=1 Tax=Shewanella piezotolerans (strain WP3 / JCM 13877) TaxID=225849 RepID=B8CVL1_SHEPW|nr:hypothetical protein swp_5073 [Shewanella piezotolerans WP3]